MKIVKTVLELQEYLSTHSQDKNIHFVPTMGNLHAGHLSLVKQAKKNNALVVVSIYVNRKQFNKKNDFANYPSTLQKDVEKLQKMDMDCLFCPDENEIYPEGLDNTTNIIESTLTHVLCGATRAGHFEGVTTVITKFLNIIQPDAMFLGEKDYQQCLVINKMVDDLFIPCQVEIIPTCREDSGLAMSSRNNMLTDKELEQAPELYRTLVWMKDELLAKTSSLNNIIKQAKQILAKQGFEIDYLTCLKNKDLSAYSENNDIRQYRLFIAAFAGKARLIDNIRII